MRVLHFQARNSADPEEIYINGEKASIQEDVKKALDKIVNLTNAAYSKKSPWIGHLNGYVYCKGTLNNTDELGRPMTFSYCTSDVSRKNVAEVLKNDLKIAGLELDKASEDCFDTFSNSNFPSFFLYALIVLIIALFFILK